MTSRWHEVRRLFETARELPPEQRASWLDEQVQGEGDLKGRVERLLRAEQEAGDFLSQTAVTAFLDPQDLVEDESVLREHERIGAYRVVRMIGQGGVSAVYLAERCDGVFEQNVAIKVIKRGMDTHSVITRFHSERQILASLDHPFIARILDGGTTSSGLPYFVMEYVKGQTLNDFLRHRSLTLRERLELFVRISCAVAYAHRRQVIHRDLKPANIVVSSDGNPKLLDFGLAKVLSSGSGEDDQTLAADRMLTPAYASPEQLQGSVLTRASDVYSLGVLLHEMVLGCRPDPSRSMNLPAVHRDGPRDLTHIVRMALREEPERRYRSADQMREDVERHLMGMPIEARHDRALFRLRRFVGRHKIGLAAISAVALVLIISSVVVLKQHKAVEAEHSRAEKRYQELRELASLMVVQFDDAIIDMPGAPPVRKALVSSALRYLIELEKESSDDPLLQREIARAYLRLGDVQRQSYGLTPGDTTAALHHFSRALRMVEMLVARPESVQEDRQLLARCHHRMALTLRQMGDWKGDLDHASAAVQVHQNLFGEHPNDPEAQATLADYLQTKGVAHSLGGDAASTLVTFERVVALRQALSDGEGADERARADLSAALRNLGLGLELTGDLRGSLDRHREALVLLQSLLENNPGSIRLRSDLMRNFHQLGIVSCALGQHVEGLNWLQRAADLGSELQRLDPNNAEIRRRLVQTLRDLGLALIHQGMQERAVEVLTGAVGLLAPWARDYQTNAQVQVLLAQVYAASGKARESDDTDTDLKTRWKDAAAHYEKSHSLWRRLEQKERLAPIHRAEARKVDEAWTRCRMTLGTSHDGSGRPFSSEGEDEFQSDGE